MANHPKIDPSSPHAFYREVLGEKFDKLHNFIHSNTFVAFMVAKKNAGKGTHANILMDLFKGKIELISVGDLVRDAQKAIIDNTADDLIVYLKEHYRGSESIEELLEIVKGQTVKKLLPTDLIVALLERAIAERSGKSILIDGFPRAIDQIEIASVMKHDFEEQGRPSVFMEINCPDEVLLERQRHRRVCPNCQDPKHLRALLTKEIEYDEQTGQFHLICNRPECGGVRMVPKQGDDMSPEVVKERNQIIVDVMKELMQKFPHEYIQARNAVPVAEAHAYDMDDFTTVAELSWDKEQKAVKRDVSPWVVKDDEGRDSYSRWPEAVVAEMISKLAEWIEKRENA